MNEVTTITSSVQRYLDSSMTLKIFPAQVTSTESVLERAVASGLSVEEYVRAQPVQAIRESEAHYLEWLRIQSAAAVEGCISTENGTFNVSKQTANLIKDRVKSAREDVQKVYEYSLTSYEDGEARRDHLIMLLYNRGRLKAT